MAILVFALGLILAITGGGALLASLDLLPTDRGMLYAVCGTVAVSASFIVFSIAALIRRIGALDSAARPSEAALESPPLFDPPLAAAVHEPEPEQSPPTAPVAEKEDALNENRAGHLPTMAEVEEAIAHPESPPTLVGRYSAGGASYMIFSDGTIEAETEQGAFRFASMGDFKAYIAGRKT